MRAALVLFHDLTVRLGIATGKGLFSVIRLRYGTKFGFSSAGFLILANLGTTAAEMAGIAAGLEIGGVSRYVSVPLAAAAGATLALAGSSTASKSFCLSSRVGEDAGGDVGDEDR